MKIAVNFYDNLDAHSDADADAGVEHAAAEEHAATAAAEEHAATR